MVISILLNTGEVKFLKTWHFVSIVKIAIFQIKILNEINFFLILIYILLQYKIICLFPLEFFVGNWHSEYIAIGQRNGIMYCNWPQFN